MSRRSAQLTRVFATIDDRAAHLATFIEGYAHFAKLPQPRLAPVSWAAFLARLEGTVRFRLEGALPQRAGQLRCRQLEQVMINLLKNAAESGSEPDAISVAVQRAARRGSDRGRRPRRGLSARHAARCAAAVLLHQADRHGSRAHPVPRDRRGARRAAEHRQPPGGRRARHGLATLGAVTVKSAAVRADLGALSPAYLEIGEL